MKKPLLFVAFIISFLLARPVALAAFGEIPKDERDRSAPVSVPRSSVGTYGADEKNPEVKMPGLTIRLKKILCVRGARPGEMNGPTSAVIGFGGIYVVDAGNYRIQKLDSDGHFLYQFGDIGTSAGRLEKPSGIAMDSQLRIYVSETVGNRVSRFTDKGLFETTFGSFGIRQGEFNHPSGIDVDTEGNVWVADTYNDRVQKFNRSGVFQQVIGGYGLGLGFFDKPSDVVVDRSRRVWVVDTQNHRLQRFNSFGQFELSFGRRGSGLGEFEEPRSLAIDWRGWVYVLDAGNRRVQVFDEQLRTIGAMSVPGSDDLASVRVSDEQLILVDRGLHRIVVFDLIRTGALR